MTSPIQGLREHGQSLWLDNMRRQLVTSGELAMLRDDGISGLTSNPTIFEKAVSGSTDYDHALLRLVGDGAQPEDILWELMLEDIQAAADVFRPVYEESGGADGFVSIEVSPQLAMETEGTVEAARTLFKRAARPNVMIKIPATRPGLPAIRQMLSEGANINVTLIFSTERYEEVVDSFQSGMEDLVTAGGDPSRVASVASFFVSRVDTKVDRLLEERIGAAATPAEREPLVRLLGKAGVANSKMAYDRWKHLHRGDRWERLENTGARAQRCLWASTSTKDPRYPDTMYVEELIGPETVNTVPPATLAAFREQGKVRRSLDENVPEARACLHELSGLGIDLRQVTAELETEGVALFANSFDGLLATIERRTAEIRAGRGARHWHSLGPLQRDVDEVVAVLDRESVPRRLWARDDTLWPPGTEPGRWMGWLCVGEKMLERVDRLQQLSDDARRDYTDVVLLGMGGSSLCPEVLRSTFGRLPGFPRLHVLDTTDPATVVRVREELDLRNTLVLVASKSGTTLETRSHLAYFWHQYKEAAIEKRQEHFAAITDPGTPLEELARESAYRWIFLNPADIGGRYSALSYFGLVPAALMGLDVRRLLTRAEDMASASDAAVPAARNPGVYLGGVLGALSRRGRNKVTLLPAPHVANFGLWLEQLLAESTGKQGRGLVPVEGEPLGRPEAYGQDRLFVRVRVSDESQREPNDERVSALSEAGHPVVTLNMRDRLDLGSEFLRWELATAVAGSLLGINPFDQPNVQESKDNTAQLLAEYRSTGKLPDGAGMSAVQAGPVVADLLRRALGDSYLAIMAYTTRTGVSDDAIRRIRTRIRDASRLATTAGYGPRFLHSTGQLHKGGPRGGLFIQVVQQDRQEVGIPGERYGFSTLKQAQALGDLHALQARNCPVVRIDLGPSPGAGWQALADALERALP